MPQRRVNSLPLVDFWSAFRDKAPPFFHPDDEVLLRQRRASLFTERALVKNFDKYVRSSKFSETRSSEFQLNLLPQPYSGDLRRARIFLLLLNPGFSDPLDLYAELENQSYRAKKIRTLRQHVKSAAFPFKSLDPSNCWTGGYRWWQGKFREVIGAVAKRMDCSYYQASKLVSERIAAVQLIPYHSSKCPFGKKLSRTSHL